MNFARTYEWLIGTRYLRSGHRRGFLSFITAISVVGLMLGVAVLVVVMSVMNGFEQELRSRILSVTSHATLMGLEQRLPDWQRAQERALSMPGVREAAPYIESRAMFAAPERNVITGAELRGIDPAQEARLGGLSRVVTQGSLDGLLAGGYRILLGSALASELGVTVGDSVVVIVPEVSVTPVGVEPRRRRFEVAGLFESGMYEYDRGLALVHVADAARLMRFGEAMSGVRLALEDPLAAPSVVRELALELGGGYYVSDWTRIHKNFFRSIQMTKSLLFVILSMIVAIAAFNIVATLVMVVKDKEGDIAILRTFGAGPSNILRVFGVQGAWIGVAGVAGGLVLGTLLAMNLESLVHLLERITGTRFLDAKVYFMSDLPARVQPGDVLQVALVALLLCLLATIYPAWRASRVLPAEALRHD
ncbi:MAG: lipoprotein-releasing ABC transporter permease subunit [Pseudomonadota bacterium]|jgi:lipoprotein-releasing system permease protein|nr:MAG: lipoprotein-releasing ABC transporter permease subunit [Pseudomonadota bacterium]